MKAASWPDRIYAGLLAAFPRGFRREYGAAMLSLFAETRRSNARGVRAYARFWSFMVMDLVQSVSREWVDVVRSRSAERQLPDRPPYGEALLAGLVVLALYIATLAPTVAFWDTGEYLTAAHILGIPHPPGNPLFVLLAHGWEMLLSPFGLPPSVSINLFSALLSAAAHALWFLVAHRLIGGSSSDLAVRRIGAAAAVILSATAFTVWNQSNVNEKVYTLSLFTVALVSWLVLRWRDAGRPPRLLLLIVFVLALTATNHLMGLLVAPALLAFVLLVDRRVLNRPRLWCAAALVAAIGLTPQFFLPIRAAQRPVLAESEPRCASLGEAAASIYSWGATGCEALSSALKREQYGKPPITLDPTVYPEEQLPRGPRLLASQFLNYAQYFNWQWGRSIGGTDPLIGGLRPLFTLLFVLLGLLGARAHWRSDRNGALYLGVLFLTLSGGLVLYLNFKYGYALERERFPSPDQHEVRERDYFFLISFSVWALWAGAGLCALWQQVASRLRVRLPRLAAAPVLGLALLPLALNWTWASRADDYTARDWAYNVLMSVEPYGVLFTNGDNDTFPLWYLQEVEGLRRDVTVMVTGYLNTAWYARQVRDLTRPCPRGVSAHDQPTRIVCQRRFEPADLPLAIAARTNLEPPDDSILPLTDQQIKQVVNAPFVVRDSLSLKASRIEALIEAGTTMLPADTFVAAIVQATAGKRPIHFMGASPVLDKLGLSGYTVRHGLTLRVNDGVPSTTSTSIVKLPATDFSVVTGAFVDLAATETRVSQVFEYRGRLLDPQAPWVDLATTNILGQYAWTHVALAQAYALRGQPAQSHAHAERAQWWQRFAE